MAWFWRGRGAVSTGKKHALASFLDTARANISAEPIAPPDAETAALDTSY
jgi:hypothetical protein